MSRPLALIVAAWTLSSAALGAAEVESPPVFSAAEILPPELARSENHRVVDEVRNDGYLNLFRIDSEAGEFEARGLSMLTVRLHEIRALAELERLSKTEVFGEAASRVAASQVEAVKEFSERPVETLKGVPSGVKRMFKRYKRTAEKGVAKAKEIAGDRREGETEGESEADGDGESTLDRAAELGEEAVEAGGAYAKRYFGVSAAERRWAQRLEIDPYTSNEILMRAIRRVARVDAAGGFAMKLAPIPRIPGAGMVARANDLAWSTDPWELRELNVRRLTELGASEELIERFLGNLALNPSRQTRIVESLMALAPSKERASAIEQAADVESVDEAAFFEESLAMLVAHHANGHRILRLVAGTRLPAAVTATRLLVVFASVDHISWTEELEEVSSEFRRAYSGLRVAGRELHLRGTASELFRRRLNERGWVVREAAAPGLL